MASVQGTATDEQLMNLVTRIYVNDGIIKLLPLEAEGAAITTKAGHCMQVCPELEITKGYFAERQPQSTVTVVPILACDLSKKFVEDMWLAIPTSSIMVSSTLKEVVEVAQTIAALVTVEVSDEEAAVVDKVLSAKGVGTRSLVRSAIIQHRFYKQLSASFGRSRIALMELKPETDIIVAAASMSLSDLTAAWQRFPAFKDGLPPGLGQAELSAEAGKVSARAMELLDSARTEEKRCLHARQAQTLQAACVKIGQAEDKVCTDEWSRFMEAWQMGQNLPKETADAVASAIPSFLRQLLVAVQFPSLVPADTWRCFASSVREGAEATT
eukprot:6479155-Amphidinium_carterae.3